MSGFHHTPTPSRSNSKREKDHKEKYFVEVDTFIGNHTVVDPEIFTLWVEGNTAQEAGIILQQRGVLQSVHGATMDFLIADIMDHYRSYTMLEKLLHAPPKMGEQWTFQIDIPTQKLITDLYYEFDDIVMREIMGRKLSSRNRKDLDEVSEKTGVNLRSCRRQFDNAKRIFKAMEELTGSLYINVKSHFMFTDELAKKYCAVVFIAGNRFEINKRKLNYLTFGDLYTCAQSMMTNWTSPIVDEDSTADVEREFLMDLRELRIVFEKEKEHKTLLCQKLKGRISEKIMTELDHNFRLYSRTLINIAYGLNHSRELKDLFIDLVEKFIEPCKHLLWSNSEMQVFLEEYADTGLQLDVIKTSSMNRHLGLKSVWKRYMEGIKGCILAMYRTAQ